ncbi:MAG: hypothetical protein CVU73_15280 [Deltaproteobacteria bacterium HGW-Deltaproteobacteria-8]|jgi:uncharacterized protein (DUF362 family)/ferredoxin|nr:MAG: hypothetical protein CVU73_15280 [Deltaproteobacteria bacterium HGW-Deltaproteobacteria-8]
MHKVLIHPATYQDCRQAVEAAFEAFPRPVRGLSILVKPNVLRGGVPEEAITTHPAVLRAVMECLLDLGATDITVGDNPGLMGYGANEACFEKCGLTEAALGHYKNIGLDAVEVPFSTLGDPGLMPNLSVSRAVLEADVLISLPKFKTHGLTVLTGALKNSYGILPGAQKAHLHKLSGSPQRFQEVIVDVFRLREPDFFVVDAVVGMQGNGPASTELRWIGKVLAADNPVALDGVIARMMGLDPALLRMLTYAQDCGLGDFSDAALKVQGQLTAIPDFKLPPLDGGAIQLFQPVQDLLDKSLVKRPKADPERCTGCGTCVAQCPAQALALVATATGAIAVVDAELCIGCFCCQEMCPEKAITLAAPSPSGGCPCSGGK